MSALRWIVAGVLGLAWLSPALAQEEGEADAPPELGLSWIAGPADGTLGTIGMVKIPEGYQFVGADDARKMLEAMGNPTDGSELGILAPSSMDWLVVFEFDDVGYVSDEDKDKIDADAILGSIKEGNEYANEERKKRGWPEVQITGWGQPPHYDDQTKNLEWEIRGSSEGHSITNYNTRILGRGGVMKANLLVSPDEIQAVLPVFKTLLDGYGFNEGQRYAEYKPGDKIAQYGLVGLMAGGAAAVAAKTGILAKLGKGLWKIVLLVGAVIAGIAKKLFGSKRVEG
jgi:uncharacterized membrane-anchored protein